MMACENSKDLSGGENIAKLTSKMPEKCVREINTNH